MPIIADNPETGSPAGMTGEADWETLLDYTGEVTEEVVRSWWGTVRSAPTRPCRSASSGSRPRTRTWRG